MRRDDTFPAGWDGNRVRDLIAHYESQSEDEAVAEDEAAFEQADSVMIEVPTELVAAVQELLTRR